MADTPPYSNTEIDARCDVLLREMHKDRNGEVEIFIPWSDDHLDEFAAKRLVQHEWARLTRGPGKMTTLTATPAGMRHLARKA